MKKQILVSLILLSSVLTMNAQTLYLPGGTGGIDINTTNSNVGIGTASPNAKLHIPNGDAIIGGNVSITPTNINSTLMVISKDNNSTTYPFYVGQPTGSDLFWILGNGNGFLRERLGIGTTTPNNKLHLYSNSGPIAMTLQTGSSYAYFGNDGNNIILASDIGSTGFKLLVNRNAPDNSMIINSLGNIGIGVTSPGFKLDVKGNGIQIVNPNANGYLFVGRDADPGNDSYFYTRITNNFNLIGSNKNGSSTLRGLGFTVGGGDTENDIKIAITPSGSIGMGTTTPGNGIKLDVIGTIRAREIKVDLNGADFVFEKDYKLMPLTELEKFVKEQKCLPEIASAKEMEKNGTELGDLNSKLLKKMEEMTLYMIEQNKKIEQLQEQNKELQILKEEIEKLKAASK